MLHSNNMNQTTFKLNYSHKACSNNSRSQPVIRTLGCLPLAINMTSYHKMGNLTLSCVQHNPYRVESLSVYRVKLTTKQLQLNKDIVYNRKVLSHFYHLHGNNRRSMLPSSGIVYKLCLCKRIHGIHISVQFTDLIYIALK